jgi:hypothetical protein
VRVRIAVAVSTDGRYSARGWEHDANNSRYDARATAHALYDLESPCVRVVHFVEADVPLPEATTIEGQVTT